MIQKFKQVNFYKKNAELLTHIITITNQYKDRGIKMTLRQLYYRLVAQNIIPNSQKSYIALSSILTDARMGGFVDWDIIEDRHRRITHQSFFDSPHEFVEAALQHYTTDPWTAEHNYIELWCEKDAISSVLSVICDEYRIPLQINRGFNSTTNNYQAYKRLLEKEKTKIVTVLYLGDHDPSGLSMVECLKNSFADFGMTINIQRIGLTHDQIQTHTLPPQPVKLSDTRTKGYVEKYGQHCWEVDALPPEVLQKLILDSFSQYYDVSHLRQAEELESIQRHQISTILGGVFQ